MLGHKVVLFAIFLFICLLLDVLGLHFCEGFSLAVASGGISSCRPRALPRSSSSCRPAQGRGHVDFSGLGTGAQELWFPGSGAQAQ